MTSPNDSIRLLGAAPSRAIALAFSLSTLAAGCAHGPATSKPTPPPAAAQRIVTEDDFARVRANYEVMSPGAPDRASTRAALEAWLLGEARREREADRNDEAWESLQRALALWDPDELKTAPHDEPLRAAAEEFERIYRRRGGHREVITLLGVQIALAPPLEEPSARARFDQVAAWLRGEERDRCGEGCERIIDDLEAAVASWPSPFLVDRLADLYAERQRAASSFDSGRPSSLAELMRRRSVQRTSFDIARLYLRVSQPERAQAALAKLSGQPGDDPALREALDRAVSPSAKPMDVVGLAVQFARDPGNRAVAARICRDAARRFPNAPEPERCAGELAAQLDQITVAIRALERAAQLEPDKRDTWEALARLHQARLAQLVGDERTEQLEAELARVEAFHAEARKRFPTDPLKTSLAGAFFEVGRGYFNAGHIDEAVRYLNKSLQVTPSIFAEEQLAQIELKRERAPQAAELLRAALDQLKQNARANREGGRSEQAYWAGKIYRGLGEAFDEMGNAAAALDARRRAVDAWDRLLAERLDADEAAEAELERGKLLYLLGERERALSAFERAIDAQPERSSTYADTLAFLVPRGEQGEVLDAYHRALGRAGVSEYIKIYASIWILDLDQRLREPEDPLARQFLEGVHGARWHHDLARWATGKESDAELATHADTPGKRCELDFYLSMRDLGAGHLDEARDLWRKVLASKMMAFFEFDMASFYLRHPPTIAPVTPAAAAAPAR